jgi:phage terminase small subunit
MPRRAEQLTPEQQRFVDEYVIDDNGTRAYLAAFPGSSPTNARTQACRLVAKPNIKAEIRAARDARQKRTRIRADTALREAARLAFSDPLYIFQDDGTTPRNVREIPPDTRRAIAEIKVRRERVEKRPGSIELTCPECGHLHPTDAEVRTAYELVSYKLWPKPKGLDKVFAHLGLAQEISPLDALLSALPAELAEQVRAALAGGTNT